MPEAISALGLHFIVGLQGAVLEKQEQKLLAELQPAGIILFRKNIAADDPSGWLDKLDRLIAQAREAAARPDFLVAVDHEGGAVYRFCHPVTHFAPARSWAASSAAVGRATGRELRALGCNLNFAPVVDIHCEPQNTVIGPRAFGTTAEEVSPPAIAFLKSMEAEGVLGCAKHFPGHGATIADSHLELPVLDVPRKVLLKRELLPFRQIIAAGTKLVMTAHVRYPAVDPTRPATLSPVILGDLLRAELGFSGVIVSDDLEMAALQSLSPGARAQACLTAGVDLLLEGNPKSALPLEIALQMRKEVLDGVREQSISEDKLVC